ncbi:MAG TPA: peptidyl-alpha-hydroxyglycine alpha-amidating lyase family protein [Rhizomicrobium sp.]|nr:peptidyl-alpha-hydroxyglycine alpha-amidating lyase family protein [Rhizomicrobium sp.]
MLRAIFYGAGLAAGIVIIAGTATQAQEDVAPKPSNLPNPYRLVDGWPTLPATMKGPQGHKWGEVIRVHLAPDGNIWVFQRCFNDKPAGDATCVGRGDTNPPILEFSPEGKLLKSFGVGLFAHPHGFTVDKDGNIWTTDTNDDETILGMSAKNAAGVTMGQEVLKISPEGKVLMTIGKEGVAGNGPYEFDRPTGVAVASNGDIFVADGHGGNKLKSARIVKYAPDGKFIKSWGKLGSEPGNFREPHDIYVGGSKGYVYVADRQNNRIQVFDQEGTFIAAWKQFGQPSSVYVDDHDNIFVGSVFLDPKANGRQNVTARSDGPNNRGIVVADAITGKLKYFIPDPGDLSKMTDTGTSASGVAEDAQGNIYAADVGENNLRKYVRAQ